MYVLSDVKETLEVTKGVIGHEFGVLGDHPALAGGDDTSAVDQRLSRLCLAGGLLALVVALVVDN